jgi:hypothetical protein
MELIEIINPSNIMFAIGLLGVIFSIFFYFKKPQENLEKKQIIAEEDLKDKATILQQKEAEGKANVLAQQFQWEKEANEKKFQEFSCRLDNSMTLAQNHIHTVDVKVDNLIVTIGKMSNEITRLATIIDERIPKKV